MILLPTETVNIFSQNPFAIFFDVWYNYEVDRKDYYAAEKRRNGVFMLNIRKINPSDRDEYISMAREFYATDAVLIHVDDSHFEATFCELIRSEDYAVCYVFELNGQIAGYSLLAKTYSQEAGGMVMWIEEIYVLPKFRGLGIGRKFFSFILKNRPENVKRFRLEVEKENEGAVRLYKSFGFDFLDYDQMIIDFS